MSDYIETIASNPKGELLFANDELIIKSKEQSGGWDTPKLRFVTGNGGLGAISFNEPGSNPGGKERLLLIGSVGDGFAHFMNPTGQSSDDAMVRLLDVHFQGATYHVPIVGASAPAPGVPRRIRLRHSATGKYLCGDLQFPSAPALFNRDAGGPWETFDVEVVA